MKSPITFIAVLLLIPLSSAISGEVVIKQEPLKFSHVRTTDGAELYDTLCVSCHGAGGRGDGPAAPALVKPVADLTVLSADNAGVFPFDSVEEAIYGDKRVLSHMNIDMPLWGNELMALRPEWSALRRQAFTRERIHSLAVHVEGLQGQ